MENGAFQFLENLNMLKWFVSTCFTFCAPVASGIFLIRRQRESSVLLLIIRLSLREICNERTLVILKTLRTNLCF